MNKIIIINSSADRNCLLERAFKELARQGFNFAVWSKTKAFKEEFEQNQWPAKKIFLGPDLKNKEWLGFYMLRFLYLNGDKNF